MRINEIFTPNDQPTITYVRREQRGLERDLRAALDTPKIVASLSGPSKTGKTVLIRSVMNEDDLIYLRGAYIKRIDDFWRAILAWFDAPSTESVTESTTTSNSVTGSTSGQVALPLVLKGNVELESSGSSGSSKAVQKIFYSNPFDQVVREIGDSEFAILIDDYHYMPKETQIEVAKNIKSLAESNVKICTALVPHRSEDVLKANSELQGRLVSIDIPEWEHYELRMIAERGFEALNIEVAPKEINRLTAEAMGSPQLMQVICLNLCRQLGINERVAGERKRISVSEINIEETLEASANYSSAAEMVQALHSGPKIKGTPRTQYDLVDGSRGDVYRAILLAITSDPIARDFTYDEIYQRVKNACTKDSPTGQSISQSLSHMCNIASRVSDGHPILEWDDANLHIADPYLAFYMRSSHKIHQLGAKRV